MKIYRLEIEVDWDWETMSYHKTLEGATKAKYNHLMNNPKANLYITEMEVQE